MKTWLTILFNVAILLSWSHLLFQVYTIDPDIQSEWKGASPPPWADQYNSMILSIKITAFINGIIVLLTILSTLYATTMTAGRR
jgi:hypothetical protein